MPPIIDSRSEALMELAEQHPNVDWPAVLAGPKASLKEVADALIAADRDPDAVLEATSWALAEATS